MNTEQACMSVSKREPFAARMIRYKQIEHGNLEVSLYPIAM